MHRCCSRAKAQLGWLGAAAVVRVGPVVQICVCAWEGKRVGRVVGFRRVDLEGSGGGRGAGAGLLGCALVEHIRSHAAPPQPCGTSAVMQYLRLLPASRVAWHVLLSMISFVGHCRCLELFTRAYNILHC